MTRTLLIIAFLHCTLGQALAQVAEIRTEARVFEVSRTRLKELGIPPRGVSAERLESEFIINIPETSLPALTPGPGLKLLQRFQLLTVGEKPAEFRIGSRVVSNQPSAESQRLDVGFDFRLLTRVSSKREITMTLISQSKIRNLDTDGTGADSVQPISSEAIRHDITTAEGASVGVGGFMTQIDAQQLSRIATLRDSPVFKYLFSSEGEDSPELILVLTPHIVSASDGPLPVAAGPAVRRSVQTTPTDLPAGKYTVQVAAFRTEARAGAYAMELSRKYPDVFVDTMDTAAKGYLRYRVRLGHLASIAAARELESQLRRDGLAPFVATLD